MVNNKNMQTANWHTSHESGFTCLAGGETLRDTFQHQGVTGQKRKKWIKRECETLKYWTLTIYIEDKSFE